MAQIRHQVSFQFIFLHLLFASVVVFGYKIQKRDTNGNSQAPPEKWQDPFVLKNFGSFVILLVTNLPPDLTESKVNRIFFSLFIYKFT